MLLDYSLDRADCLVSFTNHDGPESQGEAACEVSLSSYVGAPLRSFVSGETTCQYLEGLFRQARSTRREISVAYRCDSPQMQRQYLMRVIPEAAGGLRLSHVPIGARPYPEDAPRLAGKALVRCSQCLSLSGRSGWLPHDRWLDPTKHIVRYRVCADCRSSGFAMIRHASARNERRLLSGALAGAAPSRAVVRAAGQGGAPALDPPGGFRQPLGNQSTL